MSRQSRQGRMNARYWQNEVQKAQLGDNIANHMAYIFMEILYDKFGLSFKQLKNSDIHEFMKWCEYFIDSYWRKQPGCKDHYLNDEMIRQLFIEEEHWDLLKGCAV